jgi:dynein light chain LC8-type
MADYNSSPATLEWKNMWGARVKWPADMPDDMLKDAVETVGRALETFPDFEQEGNQVVERVKKEFDERWSPSWHCIIGKNFGSYVTHETKRFIYFYFGDKAVMLYKAG